MIEAIKNIKDTVHEILHSVPDTRDNDFLLILRVWVTQNPELKNAAFYDFAKEFKDGNYAHFESIRRVRQILQADNTSLRGKNYYKRKKSGEQTTLEIRDV